MDMAELQFTKGKQNEDVKCSMESRPQSTEKEKKGVKDNKIKRTNTKSVILGGRKNLHVVAPKLLEPQRK